VQILLRFLLESGAIVDAQNKRGETALLYAVREKKVEAVRVLLEFGADPHKKSWDNTPFVHATYAGREIVQLITKADKHKNSAVSNAAQEEMLRSASFSGNVELVRDLIQQGTNINAPELEGGWTALIYAAAKGSLDIVQILLAAGADVNAASNSGQTTLSESAYWGHLKIVNLLISAGADVNIQEIDGTTLLMKALMFASGRLDIVKVLVNAGAEPNIRNNAGKTALSIALEKNNTEAVQILRQVGTVE
jgi:ankyrin repeat protein